VLPNICLGASEKDGKYPSDKCTTNWCKAVAKATTKNFNKAKADRSIRTGCLLASLTNLISTTLTLLSAMIACNCAVVSLFSCLVPSSPIVVFISHWQIESAKAVARNWRKKMVSLESMASAKDAPSCSVQNNISFDEFN
jgi:hypothetical protein